MEAMDIGLVWVCRCKGDTWLGDGLGAFITWIANNGWKQSQFSPIVCETRVLDRRWAGRVVKVSLVVPAHNEAGNLDRLVERVRSTLAAADFTTEIVLVDDNSTDETPAICDRLSETFPDVVVVHRTDCPGFGNAIKAGLTRASGDILIPFMGDLSDDPADVPKLVAAIEDGSDLVYGSRFVSGGRVEEYPPLKLLYNRAYNNLVRLLFGLSARDVTNAFSAYRREVIEEIGVENIDADGFDLTVELPLRAHILGFSSTEVPVSWRSREAGVSKLDATRKGPQYLRRLAHLFVTGNAAALRDLFGAITSGGPTRTLGGAFVGILILVALFSLSGFESVFDVLARTNTAWLLVAAAAYFSSFFIRTWRYRVLLRTADHLAGRADVFRSIIFGWFVNFLLPARAGDAARGLALKTTAGVPFGVATGLVVVERVLDMVVLGGTMLLVAGLFIQSQRAELLAAGAFAIAALLMLALVVVTVFDERLANRLRDRFPTIEQGLAELGDALTRTARNPWALALALLLSVPVWIAEVSTIYFSARAVGIEIGGVATVTAAVAAFLAQAVPVTPAGIGTYEATIAAVLSLFGVGASEATALALADHFTRVGLVYVVGTISAIHIGFRSRAYFRNKADDQRDVTA